MFPFETQAALSACSFPVCTVFPDNFLQKFVEGKINITKLCLMPAFTLLQALVEVEQVDGFVYLDRTCTNDGKKAGNIFKLDKCQ